MTLADDYRALRRGIGARARDQVVLAVRGPDAAAYLQGQLSQDVAALGPGQGAPSLLLEPDGKLTALVSVGRLADDEFVVAVDAVAAESAEARLTRFRLRSKVEVARSPWTVVGVRGDAAAAAAVPSGGPELVAVPFGHLGWAGYDLVGADAGAAVPGDARWCSAEAWEACRVESGVPAMGAELDARTIAAEAGIVAATVSFTKGCYTGQELIARLDARGNRVARRLCGLVPSPGAADAPGAGPGAPGAEHGGAVPGHLAPGTALAVAGEGRPVGTVTSAAWCPGLGGPAALAYVHRSVAVGSVLEAGGQPVEVAELPLAR